MELLLELLAPLIEVLLQLIIQFAVDLGGHWIDYRRGPGEPANPWAMGFGYFVLGVAIGSLSLLVFPHAFIKAPWLRVAHLVITPLAAGAIMAAIGAWRRKHEKNVIRLDSFTYGALFALAVGLARFAGAK